MRRSKVLLSSMIERFNKMDAGYHNLYLIEVIYNNILNYAKTHELHIFKEELEEMELVRSQARIDAFLNRGKMKSDLWWKHTNQDTTDYGPPNHPYFDSPPEDDDNNDNWYH